MSLNELIAQHYQGMVNETATPAEDMQKQAQIEFFAKVAQENGIDLEQCSQEQINYLWNATFTKTAGKYEEEAKAKEEAIRKAKEEHEEKKEAMAKIAEADLLGRIMARSMTDELQKMASVPETQREIIGPKTLASDAAESASHSSHGNSYPISSNNSPQPSSHTPSSRFRSLRGDADLDAAQRKGILTRIAEQLGTGARATGKFIAEGARHPLSGRGAAVYGGGAALLGGGALAAHHLMKKKESAATDYLAAEVALQKVAEAGWGAEEAAGRLNALLTLGPDSNEKIAAAMGTMPFENAIELRALELLDYAGYPINWE